MSKRAEELFAKIARGKPSTLAGQWREPYTPQEEIALIDAELRKERERAMHRWEREWWGIHGITLEELYKDASDDQKEDIDRYRAAILAEEED